MICPLSSGSFLKIGKAETDNPAFSLVGNFPGFSEKGPELAKTSDSNDGRLLDEKKSYLVASWFNLIPNGFTGGVPVLPETRPIWTNAIDRYTPPVSGAYGRSLKPGEKSFSGFRVSLWRWRDAIQNDFAARMDWTVKPYAEAKHPPVPVLSHAGGITVKSGGSFHLDARPSWDPDGDSLGFRWFNYPEIGSMKGQEVKIQSAENMARVHVIAPYVEQTETLHFILAVTDRGIPALTRYLRVIVSVEP